MIVYRLTTGQYADDISGTGSKIFGGRWNPMGLAALYTSECISLAILEILVRASRDTSPKSYTLITLQIPDEQVYQLQIKKLKRDWKSDLNYTQEIGRDFLNQQQVLCLKAPSAIVSQECNFLLNPAHKDFKKIQIIATELLELDNRLFLH